MKMKLAAVGFVAIAVSSLAYALQHQITPLPISDLTCENLKGTWQFVANWEPLFDATKLPDPKTKKRPFLIDPKTGKPWAKYQVKLVDVGATCTVPNNGIVDCGGAAKCSILVTCPIAKQTVINNTVLCGRFCYPLRVVFVTGGAYAQAADSGCRGDERSDSPGDRTLGGVAL